MFFNRRFEPHRWVRLWSAVVTLKVNKDDISQNATSTSNSPGERIIKVRDVVILLLNSINSITHMHIYATPRNLLFALPPSVGCGLSTGSGVLKVGGGGCSRVWRTICVPTMSNVEHYRHQRPPPTWDDHISVKKGCGRFVRKLEFMRNIGILTKQLK